MIRLKHYQVNMNPLGHFHDFNVEMIINKMEHPHHIHELNQITFGSYLNITFSKQPYYKNNNNNNKIEQTF